MNEPGFYLSLEAAFSILLLFSLLLIPFTFPAHGLDELSIAQKQHDLLIVWLRERNFSEEELESDFNFVFSEKKGMIEFNGGKIFLNEGIKKPYEKVLAEEMHFVGSNLKLQRFVLTVYH